MSNDNVLRFPGFERQPMRLVPGRLRAARRFMRLNQAELADAIGVSRQAISGYEHGDKTPEPRTFAKLAEVLGQPTSFFTAADREVFGAFSTRFFRKFGPETSRRNDACAALGEWFAQSAKYLDNFVNYPAVDVPEASPPSDATGYSLDEIQDAADDCRERWGLGLGPISNVLALIESKGVCVCRYELAGENVEAFSFWNGERPFVFMASEKECGVRTRFDLAHELGHLVLHRWVEDRELEDKNTLKRIEREADRFAGAFLLPRRSFPNEVYTSKIDAFVHLKRRWKVSIQAMIFRCGDLGLLDEDQILNLRKTISYRNWRTREPLDNPEDIPLEQPRLLRRAAELLLGSNRRHPDEILSDLNLSPSLIEAFYNLPAGTLTSADPEPFEPSLK
jgi:Zn-dependent peptidase ImmA (M78 family)/transcriptional regulator with XRE-family HTH domain